MLIRLYIDYIVFRMTTVAAMCRLKNNNKKAFDNMAVWGEHLMILLKHHGIWKSIVGITEESG